MLLRLKQLRFKTHLCHAPEDFQEGSSPRQPGCILLDVTRAEIDLEWLETLGPHDAHWPVIGIAATADVETAVLAMKCGAFDFLLASSDDQRLKDAICEAFRWDAEQRKHIAQVQSIRRRLQGLSAVQREVLDLLLKGKSNPEIARELGVSVRSIEVRRAKVMETLKARNVAALVKKVLAATCVRLTSGWPAASSTPAGEPHATGPRVQSSPPR